MNINYVGAELVFSTEESQVAQDDYIRKMQRSGKILWANSLVYDYKVPLTAGHNDNISLIQSPDMGWGWLIDKGFEIIQTDWIKQCEIYIKGRKGL